MNHLELTHQQQLHRATKSCKEIRTRLGFLQNVGLSVPDPEPEARAPCPAARASVSGWPPRSAPPSWECCISWTSPSIGLHQRDNDKLLATLKNLRDLGNTLIVVEHDEDTMRAADYLIDVGPGAGVHGGEIVAAGTAEEVMNTPGSLTGDYLAGRKKILVPAVRRKGNGKWLTVRGASENNLKHLDVSVPLGTFTGGDRGLRQWQVQSGE